MPDFILIKIKNESGNIYYDWRRFKNYRHFFMQKLRNISFSIDLRTGFHSCYTLNVED